MRISDWSSDVGSSDLLARVGPTAWPERRSPLRLPPFHPDALVPARWVTRPPGYGASLPRQQAGFWTISRWRLRLVIARPRGRRPTGGAIKVEVTTRSSNVRSEEHTSELQSLMRISYAVFCLKKKKQ